MPPVMIAIKRLRPATDPLPLPRYMTPGAAGMDLLADLTDPVELAPGARTLVPTGLAVEIPAGYEAQIRPRSGLALRHGVTLLNAPGTIDSDYRGEVKILLTNFGKDSFTVKRGDRIAQMVIHQYSRVAWEKVDQVEATTRGAGGFGHTGISSMRR